MSEQRERVEAAISLRVCCFPCQACRHAAMAAGCAAPVGSEQHMTCGCGLSGEEDKKEI